ncbi:O-antigen ligase [Phenylobacterium sp.]|uniref:O-antigen ligase family protein n=1 Tax=Phenylobacterium sp. TaxID=1871053 RepID=UPI002735A288|nr:O-antigen ligase [Phenylobacterium sp.]MDP3660100.1 O-antigen ligase [Phenylobacterium sp.]
MANEPRLTAVRGLEMLFATIVVLMMSNALIGPLLDPKQTGGDAIPVLRLIWLPVYAVVAGLALLRWRDLARHWAPALAFALLVGWAFLSSYWSIEPGVTFRRSIAVAAATLFGVYLTASYNGRSLAELLAGSFLVLALGSYFVCLAMPSLGVHADVNAGAWRGLWYEKNQMGAMMVYGAVSATAAMILSPPRRWLWALTFVACAGLVIMTRSATSLLALLLVGAGAMTLLIMRRGPATTVAIVWLGVTALGALAMAYLVAPDMFFAALGKDPSLTGRTDIWAAVLRAYRDRPLLGYGYGAFWGPHSAPAEWIRAQLQWVVPTAHNGWLDLLIQLGEIGVALFGLIFALALGAAVGRHAKVQDGYWSTLFVAVFALSLFSESFILVQNSLPWVLAVTAITRLLGPVPAIARRSAAAAFAGGQTRMPSPA